MWRIFVTNAATVVASLKTNPKPETLAAVGPGPVYSIMRHPRPHFGEAGGGRVLRLMPTRSEFETAIEAKRAGDLQAWAMFERTLRAKWTAGDWVAKCAPGKLLATRPKPHDDGDGTTTYYDGEGWDLGAWPVADGSTLICACSREDARAGRCHRVVAADVLQIAGWRVTLDGEERPGVGMNGKGTT